MPSWKALFGKAAKPSMNDSAADPGQNDFEELVRDLQPRLEQSPVQWQDDLSGAAVLAANRFVSTPGIGLLGVITFNATITPNGNSFSYFVQTTVLPLVMNATESADSLEAAKEGARKLMDTQAIVAVMVWKQHAKLKRG